MLFCKIYFGIFWIFTLFCESDGACTFPTGVRGTWVRASDDTVFTIDTTTFTGFNYLSGGEVYNAFLCDSTSGNNYLISYSNVSDYTGQVQFVYLCLNIQIQGADSFLLTDVANVTDNVARNGVVPVEFVPGVASHDPALAVTDVCVHSVQDIQTHVFYRQNPTSIGVTCPENIFGNYNYTLDGTKCTGNSSFAVCTDRMSVTIDLLQCPDMVAYSSGGVLDCIGSVNKGGTTYFWTYNRDGAVDSSNTFRTACFAVQGSGDTFTMTYFPRDCYLGQSPDTVTAPGGLLDMVALQLCPLTSSATTSSQIAAIAGGAVGGLLVVAVVVIAAIVVIKRKKQKMKVTSESSGKKNKLDANGAVKSDTAKNPVILKVVRECPENSPPKSVKELPPLRTAPVVSSGVNSPQSVNGNNDGSSQPPPVT